MKRAAEQCRSWNCGGGVDGLVQRAALNANATNDGSGGARAGASEDAEGAPESKRRRNEAPLLRGMRRLLAREEDKERAVKRAGGSASAEHDSLDRRLRSRVAGRDMSAQDKELARHAAKTRAAELAGAGRQEDFKYALDTFRRASGVGGLGGYAEPSKGSGVRRWRRRGRQAYLRSGRRAALRELGRRRRRRTASHRWCSTPN